MTTDLSVPPLCRLPVRRELSEVIRCPCCDSPDRDTLRTQTFAASDQICQLGLLEPGDVVRTEICRLCGLVFKNPRFAGATLDAYYSVVCPANASRWRPADAYTNPVYEKRKAKRFEMNATRILKSGGPIRSVVDVGGQGGEALLPFLRRGIDAFLVDPAVATQPVLDSRIRSFESLGALAAAGLQVDAALSLHTLEHVTEPAVFLRAIGRTLMPGGRAYVEVPYDLAYMPDLFDVSLPTPAHFHAEHVNFFSPRSLRALAEQSGFHVTKVEHVLLMQLYGGYPGALGLHLTTGAGDTPTPPREVSGGGDARADVRSEAARGRRILDWRNRFAGRWYQLLGLKP